MVIYEKEKNRVNPDNPGKRNPEDCRKKFKNARK
jgi:hypothetical protein